ncbi:hypothetical protein NMY22_g9816 [Coprinellus aureogranulatus]|nr:hypothetical protein NMY22_g9816 [Coprinellus aureogranulatus]
MPMTCSQQQSPSPQERQREDLPPRYSTLSLATLPVYPTAGQLDISQLLNGSNGEQISRQSFDFCLQKKGTLTNGEDQAWATLRLFSSVPASLKRPRYTGGENVEGVVLLDLKRPLSVVSVSVVLRGQMVTSSRSDGAHCFLELVIPIWDSAMDTPSAVASGRKLTGKHAWNFCFPFPTQFPDSFVGKDQRKAQSSQSGSRTMYTTPQTLCQRGINATIQYEVTLKITTSGIFNPKHRVSAAVLYVPMVRAPPLPPLRAIAYQNGLNLVGPDDDPIGWQPLPKFQFMIRANGSADSSKIPSSGCDVECNVYIARPTTYTRGSVIPCYLVCRTPSTNAQSTGLLVNLAAQNCISLDLVQRVQYYHDPKVASGPSLKVGQGHKSDRTHYSEVGGSAIWWTPRSCTQVAGEGGTRAPAGIAGKVVLEGEIHIDIGLLPTCKVPFLVVSHNVQVTLKGSQDLEVTRIPEGNLIQHASSREVSGSAAPIRTQDLPSFAVSIVTAHAPESPIPTHFTPRPPRKKRDLSVVQGLQYEGNNFSRCA